MSRTLIDDQDLSAVTYTGTWIKGGTANEHAGTVASSTTIGDFFTVVFRGNGISVFGTIDATSDGVVANYTLDGDAPVQVTSHSGSGDTYKQQFWRSDVLPVTEHTLTVTMAKINTDPIPGEGTVWFDYFVVTDPTITSTPSSTAIGSKPTSTFIAKHASKPHHRAIAGGIVGAIGFILLVSAVLGHLWYRRKHGHVLDAPGFSEGSPYSFEPFTGFRTDGRGTMAESGASNPLFVNDTSQRSEMESVSSSAGLTARFHNMPSFPAMVASTYRMSSDSSGHTTSPSPSQMLFPHHREVPQRVESSGENPDRKRRGEELVLSPPHLDSHSRTAGRYDHHRDRHVSTNSETASEQRSPTTDGPPIYSPV